MWSPQVELVTLDQAKDRLKLPLDSTLEDDALELQLLIASERVMRFVRNQRRMDRELWQAEVDAWDADTAPRVVIGAILEQFAFQYAFRGDDQAPLKLGGDKALCPTAESLVRMLVDPPIG